MSVSEIISLSINAAALLGMIIGAIVGFLKIIDGQKCLLRTEMLRIYYHHQSEQALRQFEYENFSLLYDAYKKLHGNSFIDKVYEEVKTWHITQ